MFLMSLSGFGYFFLYLKMEESVLVTIMGVVFLLLIIFIFVSFLIGTYLVISKYQYPSEIVATYSIIIIILIILQFIFIICIDKFHLAIAIIKLINFIIIYVFIVLLCIEVVKNGFGLYFVGMFVLLTFMIIGQMIKISKDIIYFSKK